METPLKKIRIKHKLSIYEVAKRCECSPSTVSRIERGGHGVSAVLAERFSKFFDSEITEEEILYPERFADKQVA